MNQRRVRPAALGDAAAIGSLYVDAWRSAYAGLLPDRVLLGMSKVTQRHRWASQITGRDTVLVAEDETGAVVGVASGGFCRDRGFTDAGEIYTLYVSPLHQGDGHGRALLDAMLARHRTAGLSNTVLWVLAKNPSRFFYEAMGGVRAAERNEAIWGTVLPEVAYRWVLNRHGAGAQGAAPTEARPLPPSKSDGNA